MSGINRSINSFSLPDWELWISGSGWGGIKPSRNLVSWMSLNLSKASFKWGKEDGLWKYKMSSSTSGNIWLSGSASGGNKNGWWSSMESCFFTGEMELSQDKELCSLRSRDPGQCWFAKVECGVPYRDSCILSPSIEMDVFLLAAFSGNEWEVAKDSTEAALDLGLTSSGLSSALPQSHLLNK